MVYFGIQETSTGIKASQRPLERQSIPTQIPVHYLLKVSRDAIDEWARLSLKDAFGDNAPGLEDLVLEQLNKDWGDVSDGKYLIAIEIKVRAVESKIDRVEDENTATRPACIDEF